MSTLIDKWGHIDNWWYDMVWEYSLRSLTDEIIEIKQARAEQKSVEGHRDCVILYNQV